MRSAEGLPHAPDPRIIDALATRLGANIDMAGPLQLRQSLLPHLRDGTAAWIRLDGLSLDDIAAHRGVCQALVRCGVGAEQGAVLPAVVVLDWSVTGQCGAEGAAYFRVLVEQLGRVGIVVVACEPGDAGLYETFSHAGLRAGLPTVLWVPCPRLGRPSCEALGRMAVFGGVANDSLPNFLDDLAASLDRLGCSRPYRQAVMGATSELVHNVLSHAGATTAVALAMLFPRRRPKILHVGIADDGVGIAASVLVQTAHQDLQPFSDAMVTHTVLGHGLSGRAASSTKSMGGGGLSRLLKRVLSDHPGIRVRLRSGMAVCLLDVPEPSSWKVHRLAAGTGTQVRLEVRLT